MSVTSVTEFNDKQLRASQRVLDTLDRLDARTDDHYATKRQYERRTFRGQATLLMSTFGDDDVRRQVKVWTRSISASGLSFICPGIINGDKVVIGLDIPDKETAWFDAEIKRRRKVPDETFWEYGVAFHGRTEI
ncbi:PilZ domain-containing protein [Stratiformator vulcanicus]|uniref:PilZ domain protein n=1 Tax=Stratiformator vulcanicus TaxID=2527980 RepID=A0A517R7Q1_9PLAN|nr:PilZ domain-containing protein [Stratiformator vulcanicus]QDT39916.1 PilZ domain protein [Stratiformator vulcanicus]